MSVCKRIIRYEVLLLVTAAVISALSYFYHVYNVNGRNGDVVVAAEGGASQGGGSGG